MHAYILENGNRNFSKKGTAYLLINGDVDNVWGLWEHGLEKLQEFYKLANSLHPRIKTELRFSSQQVEF